MTIEVIKKQPEVAGRREVGYGGHIKDTITIFRHKGKLYTNDGVAYGSPECAMHAMSKSKSGIIFPIPSRGVWILCRPFKGKANSKRTL
jgi:hypothetical protein